MRLSDGWLIIVEKFKIGPKTYEGLNEQFADLDTLSVS